MTITGQVVSQTCNFTLSREVLLHIVNKITLALSSKLSNYLYFFIV